MFDRVLVLGCGYAGAAVLRLARARGLPVIATVRSVERAERLALAFEEGVVVRRSDPLDEAIASDITPSTLVVVAYPADGITDARIAPLVGRARPAVVRHLSSTGVFGALRGHIHDATPVPPPATERTRVLLEAEDTWAREGATILRCAAIYGVERGLHRRVVRGEHRIPGDGTRFLSRIHVDDLAALVLSPVAARGERFVVGDEEPAPHGEVVRWIAGEYGVPIPASVPLESVHESLRADRRIDASRIREVLGVKLRYPSYREGMAPARETPALWTPV